MDLRVTRDIGEKRSNFDVAGELGIPNSPTVCITISILCVGLTSVVFSERTYARKCTAAWSLPPRPHVGSMDSE